MNTSDLIMLSENYVLQSHSESGGNDFLFNIKSGEIYRLNTSSFDFLSLCDGTRGFDAIVDAFCRLYDVKRDLVLADFRPLVAKLTDLGILLGCQTAHGGRSPNTHDKEIS